MRKFYHKLRAKYYVRAVYRYEAHMRGGRSVNEEISAYYSRLILRANKHLVLSGYEGKLL